ncbi:hypothetical protein [Neobacillus drentensis]|uniref:hypothetical protein n=1 Tax=Neobacillus drentensis TaxID=220684 RepID=UPI001C3F2A56|nr:hypothetical protein [Neobacillus drentensis]
MLSHFLRAVLILRCLFNVLREYGAGETPQALQRRRGSPAPPAESEAPGAEINEPILEDKNV